MRAIAPIIAAEILLGCLGCAAREIKSDEWKITQLRASANDEDAVAEFCKDFSLTESEIRTYFRMARVITFSEFSVWHSFLPCEMTGRIIWPGGDVRFEISATLVGIVDLPHDRAFLVCEGECAKTVLKAYYPEESFE